MNHFAIIGSGQLGSRHLQAMAHLKQDATVWVADVSPESLALAKQRWEQTGAPEHVHVKFVSSINLLPSQLSAAIVATNAAIRKQVIKDLLEHSQVPYLVIEKFLFNQIEDFDEVENLLKTKKVKAWVNCPRRMYPGYHSLANHLKPPVRIQVSGSSWGLACNSIHWLDLLNFLQPGLQYFITGGELSEPHPSKRAGYLEFFGSLEIKDEWGNLLELVCEKGETIFVDIVISGNKDGQYQRFHISEQQQLILPEEKTEEHETEPEAFIVYNQSQLSGRLMEQIISTGDCDLTTYKQSTSLHKLLLKFFLKNYNKTINAVENKLCPIT
jgi:predicted dehydrogenase